MTTATTPRSSMMGYSAIMEPYAFPIIVGIVVLAIWLFDMIPRDWRYALGGLMLLLLVADSVIAGLRALIQ